MNSAGAAIATPISQISWPASITGGGLFALLQRTKNASAGSSACSAPDGEHVEQVAGHRRHDLELEQRQVWLEHDGLADSLDVALDRRQTASHVDPAERRFGAVAQAACARPTPGGRGLGNPASR